MTAHTDPTLQLLHFDGGTRVIVDYRAELYAIVKPHDSLRPRWEHLHAIHGHETVTRIVGEPLPVERVSRILGPIRQVDTIDDADLAGYHLTRPDTAES